MNIFAIEVFKFLVNLAILQIIFTLIFVCLLCFKNRRLAKVDNYFPNATVILCLPKNNPLLSDCIKALLNQSYPYYNVQIILSSGQDPAGETIADAIRNQNKTVKPFQSKEEKIAPCSLFLLPSSLKTEALVTVSILNRWQETCSPKCNALVQAVSELDNDCEVIALVDSEIIPHPYWLEELISPLADERVAATTGNCWYPPVKRQWGSWLRYLWNVSVVVQMYIHKMPWAGSLAMKTKLLHKTPLLEKWGRALSEEIILCSLLKKEKLKLKFVPSLMMINHHGSNFATSIEWMRKQLIPIRLYYSQWWAIVLHGILNTIVPSLAAILLLSTLITQRWSIVPWLASGLAIYFTVGTLLTAIMEQSVRQIVRIRNEPIAKFSLTAIARIFVTIPLAQLVYGFTLVSTLLMRKVESGGISYPIKQLQKV
jgi:cellulose synthase/poly-beta-1,6-N-acetylglucosamine synthase-like glycosyltransferase